MSLIPRLPLLPPDAEAISDALAIQRGAGRIVFFNAAGPIYACDAEDRVGVRLGAQAMLQLGLAGVGELAPALDLHRATLFRDSKRLEEGGVAGLAGKRRGPKGPRLLPPARLRHAQALLDQGASMRAVARALDVSEGTIRNAVRQGRLTRSPRPRPSPSSPAPSRTGPAARAAEDQACESGVAVKRTLDRGLACAGHLQEAAPGFSAAEAVPGAGVLLALPALAHEGLVEVAEEVYGRLKNGFFGLRSILLTLAFMALLRIRTPEQLTGHAPGELGLLLGLDRAPEVKTLRRKLRELGERKLAHTFARRLTERWVAAEPNEVGVLYIDGHVRVYNGRKHEIPKMHVRQRGRATRATKDVHVNGRRASPLFFVTAPATEGLIQMMEEAVLPEIRRLVGPDRRVTLIFDREGWSPRRFGTWKKQKFDVITYRKGKQAEWDASLFEEVEGEVDGQKAKYRLAEQEVDLPTGLRVREIRRLNENGTQTAIITTNEDAPTLEIAVRMFGRWRQENFFRYMELEFDLDHLCTNAVEAADPKRLVTSPRWTALTRQRSTARAALRRLLEKQRNLQPGQLVRVGKRDLGEEQLAEEIRARDTEIAHLSAALEPLPRKVPVDTVRDPEEIVQLERERKVFADAIKLTAYRAESALARQVASCFARHEEEARKLLQAIFRATADLEPNPETRCLTVRFHGLASPRATRALAGLCDRVNDERAAYPGTDLRLRFEAPRLQK